MRSTVVYSRARTITSRCAVRLRTGSHIRLRYILTSRSGQIAVVHSRRPSRTLRILAVRATRTGRPSINRRTAIRVVIDLARACAITVLGTVACASTGTRHLLTRRQGQIALTYLRAVRGTRTIPTRTRTTCRRTVVIRSDIFAGRAGHSINVRIPRRSRI